MREIRTICVVGTGTMGRGIAQNAATSGYDVVMVDAAEAQLASAMAALRETLDGLVAKGKLADEARAAALARLRSAASLDEGVRAADLVVEAVPESLDLKRAIFREADAAAPVHAVLATNTSSLPVGEIARATRRPERVVGMHFFNPVPVMTLLEVVRASETSDGALAAAVAVGRSMGKDPIVVKDAPGFATSRLGVLLGLEAMRMLEQGVASAEDIDKAMTLGYRHPMGPLRLTDLVGLDVRLAIAEHLSQALRSEAFRPPDILRRMVAAGKLGKKSGEGFYRWDA
ncbi:MAG TPA: 3-hydroxyacyl-CoA dehydrogenase family protein [Candidatus Sulfotelmatobacter sp.]|jgi:3-hydroxybutyryl-CoA dehydrogenase|nr:3-hydroxyacyl-CoA dehydrogenase family protein [Candidatus Sulfotelmatobacter sp.]